MTILKNKIDFALVFSVRNANPNGDPLDGNRPRTTYDGLGEVSDVCLKRKIRNRLLDEGIPIFVQSDDKRADAHRSLKDRADANPELKALSKEKKREEYAKKACELWFDVRAFGQVFAFKKSKGDEGESDAVSIGIRGPVSIQPAFSIEPVAITSTQITKSVNLETGKDPDKKAPDTMGMKHRVDYGVYVTFGSINTQTAQKTGFTDGDAETLKEALRTLFRNDATSARPDGSMEVVKLIWWRHNCAVGQYAAAKLRRTLHVASDADGVSVTLDNYPDCVPEVIDGE
jgi:CRISPR-associated protein Csd2